MDTLSKFLHNFMVKNHHIPKEKKKQKEDPSLFETLYEGGYSKPANKRRYKKGNRRRYRRYR